METGWGHGSAFCFLRFEGSPAGVQVEEVEWLGRSMSRTNPTSSARRATLGPDACAPLLEAVALLPGLRLMERRVEAGPFGWGDWSSSADFFVIVRLRGADPAPLLERSFSGYVGARGQLRYLPLKAVLAIARELLPADDRLAAVPHQGLRRTHFPDAFNANARLMQLDECWFMAEDSVEALGHLGDSSVVPTLEALRARPGLHARRARKLDALLADPGRWLAGEPKDLRAD